MVVVYDIEVLRNMFLYVDYNIHTGVVSEFEVSDFSNDLPALLEHLKSVKAQIGFNNLSYDGQVIQHIKRHSRNLVKMTTEEVYDLTFNYSQYVISARDEGRWY